jgi:hypothetical protein
MRRSSMLCLIVIPCLLAAVPSRAGVIGMALRWQQGGTLSTGQEVHAFHMSLIFDEPSRLLNIFDASWFSSTPFYQYTTPPFNPPNDTTAPNSGLFTFAPDLAFDSYVSIGDMEGADGTDLAGDPFFAMGTNTITGGWFDTNPSTPDGATYATNQVFLGQFSFVGTALDFQSSPMSSVTIFDITYKNALGNTVQTSFGALPHWPVGIYMPPPIPTPATSIALLAGLGLASRRRR